jgi:hypothetical protein
MKMRSTSSSLIRTIDASESVRAAAERRKCWAKATYPFSDERICTLAMPLVNTKDDEYVS